MGLPPPSPLPEFVYKITPEAPPQPIPEQYPLSALDQQDGFVHLSTSWQVSYDNIYYFGLYLIYDFALLLYAGMSWALAVRM